MIYTKQPNLVNWNTAITEKTKWLAAPTKGFCKLNKPVLVQHFF